MSHLDQPTFTLVDGRPVFIDIANDQYFRLPEHLEVEFLGLLPSAPRFPEASRALREALGLDDNYPALAPFRSAMPKHSLVMDQPRAPARIVDVLRLWRILRKVRRTIKAAPLSACLARLKNKRAEQGENASDTQIIDATTKYLAARRLIPIAEHCLTDSFALLAWLGPAQGADLIFGVKLDPFAAHCWVQLDTLLLNDRLDVIERFQPIRSFTCLPNTP